jgi:hypothetical protein
MWVCLFTNWFCSFVSGKCDQDISLLLITQSTLNVSKYQPVIAYMKPLRWTSVAFQLTVLLILRVNVVVPLTASEAIRNCWQKYRILGPVDWESWYSIEYHVIKAELIFLKPLTSNDYNIVVGRSAFSLEVSPTLFSLRLFLNWILLLLL